jgi:cytochrome c nitrite reductase small subunit
MFHRFKWVWVLCALIGAVIGLGAYTLYASRSWVYLTDKPEACTTCHVMGSYYQSWSRSSHAVRATCNDCHVPQSGLIQKWAFKAADGLYHASVFSFGADRQVIRPREGTYEVLLANCLRCHSPLVTEFAKMSPDWASVKSGAEKACWDCHRQTPHTNISSPSSINYGGVPLPEQPVPGWLKSMISRES